MVKNGADLNYRWDIVALYARLPDVMQMYGTAGAVHWLRGQLFDLFEQHNEAADGIRQNHNQTRVYDGLPPIDHLTWRLSQRGPWDRIKA